MFFFFQAEDGIRYLVRSRGLGDVYKRQGRGIAGDELLDELLAHERADVRMLEDVPVGEGEILSLIHI